MDQQLTIICPPADATSFEVGGITYTATDGLSVARGRFLDRFVTEALFGMNMPEYVRTLDALKLALNKVDFVECAAIVSRYRESANLLGSNRLRSVEIVGLFFNSKDEDPAVYDFEAMQRKCYTAWGAVHRDFFQVVSSRFWSGGTSPYTPTEAAAPAESSPAL